MTLNSEPVTAADAPDPPSSRMCRTAQIAVILIATILHGIFLSQAKPLQSANDRSRWCTVWSLVERGTFQIDEIRQRPGWNTIDLIHSDGHFYSTKPPLFTTIVAGITWCVQRVTGWNLLEQTQSVTFVVLLLTNLVPFFVSLLCWIAMLQRTSQSTWTRLVVVTIAAFATLLTPFLMTLNNHTIAAATATISLYAILKILQSDSAVASAWWFALCGFMAACTTVNELPAACLAAILMLLAARHSWKKTWICFVPAAAVPLIALIATNMIATGSWKPVYADYGTDKYRFVIDGVPSYWMEPHGIDQNLDSPWFYFIHCTIGHHGLFSLTPIALLAVVGWLTAFRMRDCALKSLLLAGAATTAIVTAFYLTRTQNYNYGGVSCALRWALWLTPLWLLALIPVLDAFARFFAARCFVFLLIAISMYSAWQPIDNPWRQPWLFQWMEARGYINYSDPPLELPKPLWTWFAALPTSPDGQPTWIEFQVTQPGNQVRHIRLSTRPDSTAASKNQIAIDVAETSSDETIPARTRPLLIDKDQFEQGASPGDFLRWNDPKVTGTQQQSDLAFVRGLPLKAPYRARIVRFLKTSLRPEALRCIQAAAQVTVEAADGKPAATYRCDTWLTDDVPFGFVQVEFHITQTDTGSVLFHERWTVHDCWPKVTAYTPPK